MLGYAGDSARPFPWLTWNDRPFNNRFELSNKSEIKLFPLESKQLNGKNYNGYTGIEDLATEQFNLYIVDGPFGTPDYSRFDIHHFVKNIKQEHPFIIIIDDYNRSGEKQTAQALLDTLKSNNVAFTTGTYLGGKEQLIITSPNYQFVTSL